MVIIRVVFLLSIFSCGSLFSANSRDFFWDKASQGKHELIEEIPDYNSLINWTAGKVHTEASMLITGGSPNVGKYVNEYHTSLRDELRQNLIKAMGALRISDIFLVKDYFSQKSDVRYEIISQADRAFYYPIMQRGKYFHGVVELDLYGKNGIGALFYRDLENYTLTNYVQQNDSDMEYFDGLILDTMIFPDFQPSLQMRIYDQDGVLLYGPETVEHQALEKDGVCLYTTSLTYAFNHPRSGSHVFYSLPYALKGRMNTDFVLNNKDAARLFANPRTLKYINQGKVLVVKSPRKKD